MGGKPGRKRGGDRRRIAPVDDMLLYGSISINGGCIDVHEFETETAIPFDFCRRHFPSLMNAAVCMVPALVLTIVAIAFAMMMIIRPMKVKTTLARPVSVFSQQKITAGDLTVAKYSLKGIPPWHSPFRRHVTRKSGKRCLTEKLLGKRKLFYRKASRRFHRSSTRLRTSWRIWIRWLNETI